MIILRRFSTEEQKQSKISAPCEKSSMEIKRVDCDVIIVDNVVVVVDIVVVVVR